jgi:Mn-containing catalase
MKAFTAALESLGKDPFSIGTIPPTPVLVDQYFNDSTGVGDEGETDARGPWNEGGDWEMVEASQLQKGVETWRTLATQESGRGDGRLGSEGETRSEAPKKRIANRLRG